LKDLSKGGIMGGSYFLLSKTEHTINRKGLTVVVIYTGEFNEVTCEYEVLCELCHTSVGWMNRAELSEMTVRGDGVMCFDCEGASINMVPPCLVPGREEFVFIANEAKPNEYLIGSFPEYMTRPHYVKYRVVVNLCLSSRSNLHETGVRAISNPPREREVEGC
jgi:hypothetical protein